MRAWSESPYERVTPLREVTARGTVLATENGESEVLYEIADQPGWIVKRYRPGFPRDPVDVLDRLIALPSGMPPTDLALVDSSTSWPVSRVVDGDRTVGVILARAPAAFSVPIRLISGTTQARLLEVDQLVQTDPDFFTRRGWEPPTVTERLAVARGLAAVGAVFERHDVVYGDWSYANAFWTRGDGRVFVIDVDSCGIADRPWAESKSWDDPSFAPGTRLTTLTDRYKLAVLVLRCLSGVRGMDFQAAHAALPPPIRGGPLGTALRTALTADPERRPAMSELLALLDSAVTDLPGTASARSSTTSDRSSAPPDRPGPRTADRSGARVADRRPDAVRAPSSRSGSPEPSSPAVLKARASDATDPAAPERVVSLIVMLCFVLLAVLAVAGLVTLFVP
ncbi:hypothetical protein AB0L00_18285 [Actinoallomurus sp. NPDC052308]|uniref:hypothetical protein n=1 Tax=Actinoallomurus sp. NPDC052308 TaxID=3155530 RepID=UPI003424CB35